jgi:heat shock protein HslJ
MRRQIWAGILLALAMSAEASGNDRLLGDAWRAVAIQGGGVIGTAQSTIRIAAGGRVTGSGGCNRMFGTASISGSGIAFGGMGTTRMACAGPVMAQESRFLGALAATRSFRFDGPHLIFHDAAGAEAIRFAAQR